MAAHRYWRIRSPTANPYGLSEVEMRTTVGGSDVTTGGTAIASGNFGGFPPSNCFDNNNSTLWTTFTVSPPGGGHWIGYDFGSGNDKDIVQFTLRSRGDGFASEAPTDPIFEYSDDGSSYTSAGSITGLTWSVGETKTFTLGASAARFEQVSARIVSSNDDNPPPAGTALPVVFVVT